MVVVTNQQRKDLGTVAVRRSVVGVYCDDLAQLLNGFFKQRLLRLLSEGKVNWILLSVVGAD